MIQNTNKILEYISYLNIQVMPLNESEVTKSQSDLQESSKKIQKKAGHWNQEEHESYLRFLLENANHSKGQRLFKKMSQIIGTRTPSQCRSHHQKFNPSKPTIKIAQTRLLKTKQLVRLYMQKHKVKDEDEE
ncbi:unnamed protein product (macronuclear) [Paramecium tetraurelia]|uniref:Myb-like domain-containing protein n=1 Tax=Paramecium tetraurelia TaxID=5888 RepID=A0DL64_PARTE|nr:uncharacterized protein GSPATT00018098001 [Paramecium tetraurelia]CAK83781.1 unnamed protein product [Paramecium tetraurelia]|eukprot:XP_001451178.1 hypothetical protein (macronuclear) [Paramecium tetraurelia strain d4-2]